MDSIQKQYSLTGKQCAILNACCQSVKNDKDNHKWPSLLKDLNTLIIKLDGK